MRSAHLDTMFSWQTDSTSFPCCKGKWGESQVFSPREFAIGQVLDLKKDSWVPFDSYVEASVDAVVTNSMSHCTHACISLGPSGNLQGSVKCFDLLTF